jgi:alpha-L-fucosidase
MSATPPVPEPRVARFETLAYGLFLHWGLYSQLGEGEWIEHLKPIPREEYEKLFDTFTAEDFDARATARFARECGMRYITLTTRHHEGFSLYDTRGLSDFDAPHSPAKRDLVAEFVEGCRAEEILPVFYHTTLDWHWGGAKTPELDETRFNEYLDYLLESVRILCTHYGEIGGLWFDGNWSRQGADWKEDRLYRMIRELQPEAMIINNTGLHAGGALGHPEIDSVTYERQIAKPVDRSGMPKYVAGEMCQTMNGHWGVGRRDFTQIAPAEVIETLCRCRKAGANLLLNVGPEAQGALPELESAILRHAGRWIELAGPVVYEGRPTGIACQGRDFVLEMNGRLYYFAFGLGIAGHTDVTAQLGLEGPRALKGVDRPVASARWLDSGEELRFAQDREAGLLTLDCTGFPYGTQLVVRIAEIDLD